MGWIRLVILFRRFPAGARNRAVPGSMKANGLTERWARAVALRGVQRLALSWDVAPEGMVSRGR